jgi:hypothetical protein
MALNKPLLASEIKANIIGCFGLPEDDPKLNCFCQAVANAVIDHFIANADVLPGSFTSPAGPVTGIGDIT